MTWDVYVIDGEGNPVTGKKVLLLFTAFGRGRQTEYTDDEGHACFDEVVDEGEAVIYVNDVQYGPYHIEEGAGFTIEID